MSQNGMPQTAVLFEAAANTWARRAAPPKPKFKSVDVWDESNGLAWVDLLATSAA